MSEASKASPLLWLWPILVAVLATLLALQIFSLFAGRPATVTVTSPVCPPAKPQPVKVVYSDLIKDCLFSDPCAFRSRFDVERDLRSLRSTRALRAER